MNFNFVLNCFTREWEKWNLQNTWLFYIFKLTKTSSTLSQYLYGNRIILRIKDIINDNTVNVITSNTLKECFGQPFNGQPLTFNVCLG